MTSQYDYKRWPETLENVIESFNPVNDVHPSCQDKETQVGGRGPEGGQNLGPRIGLDGLEATWKTPKTPSLYLHTMIHIQKTMADMYSD